MDRILRWMGLVAALLIYQIQTCFIAHFVYYSNLPNYYFDRFLNFPHPYTVHYDEHIEWTIGVKVERPISQTQLSDIKRMEVLYKYGGLYLDSDLLVNIQCLKKALCTNRENNKLYLLNETQKNDMKQQVPIGMLFAPQRQIEVIKKILSSYDQSIYQTVLFSGPKYVHKFKDQLGFVNVDESCSYHIGTKTFARKSSQYNWIYQTYQLYSRQNLTNQQKKIKYKQRIQFFTKLWKSKSIIYPSNFDFEQLTQFNHEFNHVQIVNKEKMIIKVIQYSKNSKARQRIQQIVKISKQNQNKKIESLNGNFILQFESSLIEIVLIIVLGVLCMTLSKKLYPNYIKINQQDSQNKKLSTIKYQSQIQNQPDHSLTSQTVIQTANKKNKMTQTIKYCLLVLMCLILILILFFATINIQHFTGPNKPKQSYHQQFEPQTTKMLQFNKNYRQMYGIPRSNTQTQPIIQTNLKQIGLIDHVQLDSKLDYLNLTSSPQFQKFKSTFEDTITYDVLQFKYNKSLEKQKQYMVYTDLKTHEYLQYTLQNIQALRAGPKLTEEKNLKTYLASLLVFNRTEKRVKQLQYYYYNKTYNLDAVDAQVPICIISTGYQIYSKNRYIRFFQSIQQQNYSNYHVVIVDDNSPDQSARRFYDYLETTNYKLKNRVKIIRSHVNLGALVGMYVHVKKFCNKNDIVVNVDNDDALIGHQVFNVLSSVYKDPNIWYVYTTYFTQLTMKRIPLLGQFSHPITVDIQENRLAPEWNTSHMRTYRQFLMERIPMQQLVEYFYDQNNNLWLPRFYTISADRFVVYAHLQLAGNERIKFIKEPFYYYDPGSSNKICNLEYEHLVEYKSRIKRIMKPLKTVDANVQYYPDKQIPVRILKEFQAKNRLFTKCMKIFYENHSLF